MKTKRTEVSELVKQIENELSARESAVASREDEATQREAALASDRAEFELVKEELLKEKAGFDHLKAEVDAKLAKIRNDQQLSEDLQTQANQAKHIEKVLADTKEERGLIEHDLKQIEKREIAVTEREKNYKEEIAREFATKYLKI